MHALYVRTATQLQLDGLNEPCLCSSTCAKPLALLDQSQGLYWTSSGQGSESWPGEQNFTTFKKVGFPQSMKFYPNATI